MIQVSPHTPALFLTSQQPTARCTVRPSRAARCRDFHPFAHGGVIPVTWKPVSVSPDFPLHKLDWVEGGVAAPSALRNVASPITGTTLQRSVPVDWRSTGTEVRKRVWGWQPRHIQESVWTTDPFTDRIASEQPAQGWQPRIDQILAGVTVQDLVEKGREGIMG